MQASAEETTACKTTILPVDAQEGGVDSAWNEE